MNRDEIMAEMDALVGLGETRALEDAEVSRYEELEGNLKALNKTDEIRARQQAYNTVAPALNVATVKQDDTLERAFEAYLRTGIPNHDISELRAQSVGTNSAGGYTVPRGFMNKLVEVQKAFGGARAYCSEITTSSGNPLDVPTNDDTGNIGAITAENAAIASGADLVFGQITFGAYKYTAAGAGSNLPLKVSVELLQDSAFDVSALVASKLGTRIARKQALDIMQGDNSGKPQGLFSKAIDVERAGAESYANLLSVEAALDPAYEDGAVWVMNKRTWISIRGLVDSTGRPIVASSMDPATGKIQPTLFGYPVVLDQQAPDYPGTTSATGYALLGNLKQAYMVRNVADVTVIVNPYSSAANGQVEYSAWARMDARYLDTSAVKIYGNAA